MADLIDRQAAIDTLACLDDYEEQEIEILRKLPSAQPNVHDASDDADYISRETMKDVIDSTTWYHQNHNKDMVEGASDEETAWFKAKDVFKAIENVPSAQAELSQVARDIATIIENEKDMRVIASAQPERKEGHWIRKSNWMWTCSCCGKDNAYAYVADDACEPTVLQDFFCPNCGAEMEVEKDA